jgi:hypothetical protein
MLDLKGLRTEIQTDPEHLGYAAAVATGSANQIAESINTPRYAAYGPIPITPVLIWLATWGIMPRLREAAQGEDRQVAGIAEVAMMLVSNPNIPALDVGLQPVQYMLTALVQAGVIPMEASDDLLALGATQKSRAEILGFDTVTADDVSRALEE